MWKEFSAATVKPVEASRSQACMQHNQHQTHNPILYSMILLKWTLQHVNMHAPMHRPSKMLDDLSKTTGSYQNKHDNFPDDWNRYGECAQSNANGRKDGKVVEGSCYVHHADYTRTQNRHTHGAGKHTHAHNDTTAAAAHMLTSTQTHAGTHAHTKYKAMSTLAVPITFSKQHHTTIFAGTMLVR